MFFLVHEFFTSDDRRLNVRLLHPVNRPCSMNHARCWRGCWLCSMILRRRSCCVPRYYHPRPAGCRYCSRRRRYPGSRPYCSGAYQRWSPPGLLRWRLGYRRSAAGAHSPGAWMRKPRESYRHIYSRSPCSNRECRRDAGHCVASCCSRCDSH